jgi:hypothetical protein
LNRHSDGHRSSFWRCPRLILAALAMIRYVDRLPLAALGLSLKNSVLNLLGGTVIGAILVLAGVGILAMFGMVEWGDGIGSVDNEFCWSCVALFFNVVNQEVMVHGYAQQIVRGEFRLQRGGVCVVVSVCTDATGRCSILKSVLLLTNLLVVGAMLGIAFLVVAFAVASDRDSLRLESDSRSAIGTSGHECGYLDGGRCPFNRRPEPQSPAGNLESKAASSAVS